MKDNLQEKIIQTIFILGYASVTLAVLNNIITDLQTNLTGWSLIGLFSVSGIMGALILFVMFDLIRRLWTKK